MAARVPIVWLHLDQHQVQLPHPDALMEAFHHTVVPTEELVQTVLYHPDQRQVQQLQQDVPMEVFHHTAVPTEVKDLTALYQLDHRQDQLKATSIFLPVQMEELDQHVKLDRQDRPHHRHDHQLPLLVVLMVVFPLTVVQTVDKARTA